MRPCTSSLFVFLLASSTLATATGCGDDSGSASSEGAGGTGASAGGAGGGGGAGAGDAGGAPTPDAAFLPSVTGTCPTFEQGDLDFLPTTADGGPTPRTAHVWIDPAAAAELDGPLVFYWHGAGSSPTLEPPYGLSSATIDAIKALGGLVVAPYPAPDAGQLPWALAGGGNEEVDLLLADEVLACAIEQVGVDLRRIHTIGMSAGGLNTAQMSYRRSGYLASVVAYSGGLLGAAPARQDPDNKLTAFIFHGGATDKVIVQFDELSAKWRDELAQNGQLGIVCDHGMGHEIPVDARGAVWQFFQDHPYGVASPYADGLPEGFPSYCSL